MDPVIVVGGGISGISCARALAEAGLPVRVLDRAGQAGGRMASERHAGRAVDTGASYFTVSDERFEALVRDWQRRGLARPWTDTFGVHEHRPASEHRPSREHRPASEHGTAARVSTGPLRWAAAAGLRSLVQDLADTAGLGVEQADVQLIESGTSGPVVDAQPAAAVVLAMPDPQARALLHPTLTAERAGLSAAFDPVLVLSAGWPERTWSRFDGIFVNGDERLSWIADDGSRRGDAAPVLVAHSTPSWAATRHRQPEDAAQSLLQALREVLDLDTAPAWTQLHHWQYAKPAAGRTASFGLWPGLIGACGDGWSPRPRVEAAFLSGLLLGQALAGRLSRQWGGPR